MGVRVSASFAGHVKSAKRFNPIDFIKEEKLTIILTLLGALGILLLQFVAWKDIRSEHWAPASAATVCTRAVMMRDAQAHSDNPNLTPNLIMGP